MSRRSLIAAIALLPRRALGLGQTGYLDETAPSTQLTHILQLQNGEEAFAYARISPDGTRLAYSPTTRDGTHRELIRVTDLSTGTALFEEPGVDPYWSPDGTRLIFLSHVHEHGVSILSLDTLSIARNVAPATVGDYFSWGSQNGVDTIVTVQRQYFRLTSALLSSPVRSIGECDGALPLRPLVSKDGSKISAFVDNNVVVRRLGDCSDVVCTNLEGAKADFSWDGRYLAFHAQRPDTTQYEIRVVDLHDRTYSRLSGLPGSCLFPSWTRDNRLCFRYDTDAFHGFAIADAVLAVPRTSLPDRPQAADASWSDIFPDSEHGGHGQSVVLVWSTWSAHSREALRAFQDAANLVASRPQTVFMATAVDPQSKPETVRRLMRTFGITVPLLPLPASRLRLTGGHNQMPCLVFFGGGQLSAQLLGAHSTSEIVRMIDDHECGRRNVT